MTQIFLTSASTSPLAKPGDWQDTGHTVEMLGAGGSGAAGARGATTSKPGGGGGGGAYRKLLYSSGALGATTSFAIKANNTAASQTTNATYWEGTTNTNSWGTSPGQPASTITGGAGGSTTLGVSGSPSPVTYTSPTAFAGGAAATLNNTSLGGGGGGAGAAGNTATGKAGGTNNATGGGGGGGGGSSGSAPGASDGGAPTTTTGGIGGGAGGGTGGGTTGNPGTQGGGGEGSDGTASAVTLTGGNGGPNTDIAVNLDNSAGCGGGGGATGGASGNNTSTHVPGNGGLFGGGGAGTGAARGASSANTTPGTGASGVIVITYNPVLPWTPAFLTGLQAWYKADAGVFSDLGTTPAVDGDTVRQWNDQSGNGVNLTNSGAAGVMPTYQTVAKTTVGNQHIKNTPAILYDTSGTNTLKTGAAGFSFGTIPWSVFAVLALDASNGNGEPVIGYIANGQANVYDNTLSCEFMQVANSGGVLSYSMILNLGGGAFTSAIGEDFVHQVGNIRTTAATQNDNYYVDGKLDSAGGPASISTTALGATGELSIGWNSTSTGSTSFIGPINEVVITNTALTNEEFLHLSNYFRDRWQTVHNQFDWPLTGAPEHAISLRAWTQNLQQTTLKPTFIPPPGAQVFTLPPIGMPYPQDLRGWTQRFQLTIPPAPAGKQITDLPPRAEDPFPRQLRQWAWQYNANLVGQDKMLAGEQIWELAPRPYQRPADLITWTWSYNRNLIGKDAMIVGEQVTDLPPRDPREGRSWIWNYNLNLIGQDKLPVGEILTDRPPTITWYQTWQLNLLQGTLTPGVAVPFAQTDWPLSRAPQQAALSWTASYNLNLIGQDRFPAGDQFYDRTPVGPPPPVPSWTWQYNVNLIGQDQFPPGKTVTEAPPRVTWLLGWSQNLLQTTLAPSFAKPFLQADWPLPRAPGQSALGWTSWYNLNLIGQDRLPVGEQTTDLPPRAPAQPTPIWTASYNRNLVGQDQLPVGDRLYDTPAQPTRLDQSWITALVAKLSAPQKPTFQSDWPLPTQPIFPTSLRTWIDQTKLLLAGQDRFPPGVRATDLPQRGPQQAALGWTWQYNLNLIGQDQLPAGARAIDLPPAGARQPDRGWITLPSPFLFAGPRPFLQSDWPVPVGYRQPDRSFAAFYNPNLIGKDRFPPGTRITDLAPIGYPPAIDLRTALDQFNLPLVPPPTPPPPSTDNHNMPFFATPGMLKSW